MLLICRAKTKQKMMRLSMRNQETKQPACYHQARVLLRAETLFQLKTGRRDLCPSVVFPRQCSRLFGEDGMTLKLFVKKTAPFSILWTLTNYLYLLALKKLTATDVSALYCCHKAFVFLLSWIVLKDRFMGVRVRKRNVIQLHSMTDFLSPELKR